MAEQQTSSKSRSTPAVASLGPLLVSSLRRLLGRRHAPLGTHLVVLVLGAMLPIVAFAVFSVARVASGTRAGIEEQLRRSADELAQDVDQGFQTSIAALQVLARSRTLDAADLREFYEDAERTRTDRGWGTVVLIDRDGTQVLNLLEPLGTAMPNVGERPYFVKTRGSGRPVVSDLYRGSITGNWVTAVAVPVVRGSRVRYVLAAILYGHELGSLVGGAPSRALTRLVVDRSGRIAARIRAGEDFTGRPAPPELIAAIARSPSGSYTGTTEDRGKLFVAFARAPMTGWTVALEVPEAGMTGALQRSVAATAVAGIALLVVGVLVALLVGRRVAGGIADATAAAEVLAAGRRPAVPGSSVTEVTRLGAALEASARLLDRRERERTEALEREREARREAENASQAKDHFLAVLSHELRTPLTPVLTGIALLQRNTDLPPQVVEHLAMMRRNVEVEGRLIDDLLDLTRIARGKLVLERRRVELGTIVGRAVEVCRPDIDARRLHLGVDLGPGPYIIEADAGRLQQVFWNLLKNAIKFTPRGGCVGMRCRPDGDHVVVDVMDSGIGIEPSELPRIFDAFAQAQRSGSRQFGGLGLGLAISKALVKAHGGTIGVESEGADRGATFTVRLPVLVIGSASGTVSRAGGGERPEPGSQRHLHILLVEDHGDTAQMIRAVLELEGHTVETAGDVATALRTATTGRFDLLVSDVGLPDGTGLDLMRELRSRGEVLPGIAISGYGQERDIEQSRAVGFRAHLVKPIDPDRLIGMIG